MLSRQPAAVKGQDGGKASLVLAARTPAKEAFVAPMRGMGARVFDGTKNINPKP